MRISWLRLKGFQQFEDVELDLTDPETGEPLEAVCFIGPNGTGKSTLLRHIWDFLRTFNDSLDVGAIQVSSNALEYNGGVLSVRARGRAEPLSGEVDCAAYLYADQGLLADKVLPRATVSEAMNLFEHRPPFNPVALQEAHEF